MQTMCLLPIALVDGPGTPRSPVRVPPPGSPSGRLGIWRDVGGGVRVAAIRGRKTQAKRENLVGELKFHDSTLGVAWWLVPRDPELVVNGVAPLPFVALQSGDLLAVGAQHWFLAALWTPEPQPVPEALADRQCPVCGGELRLAPVCQCPCGRYCHLEAPGATDNDEVLNCYLTGPCGLCGREPTLDPVLLPHPPEQLFDAEPQRDSAARELRLVH